MKEDSIMSIRYEKKNKNYENIIYTVITLILVCALLLFMVRGFYTEAKEEAYEMLHMQTKQIKDSIILQIESDRENLVTMANFAAKLYADGESYDIMFESFKPIGLFSEIGILNPDNIFVTRAGTIDLKGKISFDDEAARGAYISGRIADVTTGNKEILRSAVPIISNGQTVGILYGVISVDHINQKYSKMARELDAQLFVYDKYTGNYVIDTFNNYPGTVYELENRKYNKGYSYEQLMTTGKGYTSFKSKITGEDLYVHYSTIEECNWGIILARYESQVFANVNEMSVSIVGCFIIIGILVILYLVFVFKRERRTHLITDRASGIRKLLLDFNQQYDNVFTAMKYIQQASLSGMVFYANSDRDEYRYTGPGFKTDFLETEEWQYFVKKIFEYIARIHNHNKSEFGIAHINANSKLLKANPELYEYMKKYGFKDVRFSIIVNKRNRVSVLGVVNAGKTNIADELLKDISACFSIAVYNRKHLNKTEIAATTDSLTGALNRVAYKKDILVYDSEKPYDFACIYIDVNELHIRNNKYGHAAGDEMLMFIANSLKETFYGNNVYRMGGDEFLVFTEGIKQERLNDMIDIFLSQLQPKGYHVAVGLSYRTQNTSCEEMVREAELRMYTAKSQYYLSKEQNRNGEEPKQTYVMKKTGIREIDTMLSVLKEHYHGIYRVTLSADIAHRILMPSYLGYSEEEKHFSKLISRYIEDSVAPDYQRPVMNFLNYEAITKQLSEGSIPKITYKKNDGETVILSIYRLDENPDIADETLWVFSKA